MTSYNYRQLVYSVVLFCLLVVLSHLTLAEGYDDNLPSTENGQLVFNALPKRAPAGGSKRICGTKLREVFSLVCLGRYQSSYTANLGRRRRRYVQPGNHAQNVPIPPAKYGQLISKRLEAITHAENFPEESVFLDSRSASIFLQRRDDAQAGGAYTECCLKPCVLKEMVGYCHPDVQKTTYSFLFPK